MLSQLVEILDSNGKISYDARSAVIKTVIDSWDPSNQTYQFEKDSYIEVSTGKIVNTKPSETELKKGYLHLIAGSKINLEIIL